MPRKTTVTKRRRKVARKPRDIYQFDDTISAGPPPAVEYQKPARVARTVSWPKTLWQHVKQDLFPRWALLRWPVETESVTYWQDGVLDGTPVPVVTQGLVKTEDGTVVSINGREVGRALPGGTSEFTMGDATIRIASPERGVYQQTTVTLPFTATPEAAKAAAKHWLKEPRQ